MSLLDTLNADLKTAMLSGEKLTTETLRMLKSAIIYAKTDQGKEELSDSEITKIIRKEVKKRTEAADGYRKAESPERAEQEEQEAKILGKYLPPAIEASQIKEYVASLHASNPDIQKSEAIKTTIAHFDGEADGRLVVEIISSILS